MLKEVLIASRQRPAAKQYYSKWHLQRMLSSVTGHAISCRLRAPACRNLNFSVLMARRPILDTCLRYVFPLGAD